MRIKEFIETYCKDLIDKAVTAKKLIDTGNFPYDEIVTDSTTGDTYKAIVVAGEYINIIDILTLAKDEFVKFHPSFEASVAFDGYLESIEIQEGPEALLRVRNAILKNREMLLHYDMPIEDI